MPYAYCPAENFDAQTQTCTAVAWTDGPPGGLPPLSIADASQIGTAIIVCWAVGYSWRLINRQIGDINK